VPVNVLYCEGNSKSIDIRAIRQIVPKDCKIQPLGGKNYGFEDKIISDRAINPRLAGLIDRDFDCRDFTPTNTPVEWPYQNVQIGWSWERKEIENYLIDPEVVQRALGHKAPPIDGYITALKKSAETISAYTAARTALSCYRFKNCWGNKVGKTHELPPQNERDLGKNKCIDQIKNIVEKNKGERIVKSENVVEKFENLLPSFRPNGFRFENFLTFFAGKDLLYVMKDRLREFGFESKEPVDEFIERILIGIERSENIWTWLPEWEKLRELIVNFEIN